MTRRLPSPFLLVAGCTALAALLTWVVPAGEYARRADPATGRTVVVAGTYAPSPPAPVGPFAALVAIPRGFVEAADVVGVVLFVGGAWGLLDRTGALARLIGAFLRGFAGRRGGWLPIVCVSLFFTGMGALENMQEEIIPLVPMLLVLAIRLGVPPVVMMAASAGSAMVGSAFGPTNPFQAALALQLAELPPLSAIGLRSAVLVAAGVAWTTWTVRGASRWTPSATPGETASAEAATSRDALAFVAMLSPMAAYVYGTAVWGWGFNELSGGFLLGGVLAGLMLGLSLSRTIDLYWAGMQDLLPAALLVGASRSIALVLADGHVMDTILHALAGPLAQAPAGLAALLMVPFHMVIHVPVASVSGQAVLTLPLLVPLSDLLTVPRQATVMAYQTGSGLTELLTPTNGSLLAILLAAGVPFRSWLRFIAGGVVLLFLLGIAAILAS